MSEPKTLSEAQGIRDVIAELKARNRRLERDNAALLAACKVLREHAKGLRSQWDASELNDSHFGKNLKALAGWGKGYHVAYDGFHEAIAAAEKAE